MPQRPNSPQNSSLRGLDLVGEMRERIRLLQVEVRGQGFVLAAQPASETNGAAVAFVNVTIHHRHRRPEAVAVFDGP
jgi:hypothetical protein